MRNSKAQYRPGGDLSFEYRQCLEAGLTYEVAQRIEFSGCGNGAVVNHLIAQKFQTPEAVDEYVRGLGCLKENSEETMNALVEKLKL